MAKTNIKAGININSPVAMITQAEAVTKKHESYSNGVPIEDNPRNDMGEWQSPLIYLDMNKFKTDTIDAKILLASANEMHARAEGLSLQAYTIMGFAKGQTIRTPNTLYFEVDKIRGILLSNYSGDEEQLEQYGFNVVITKKGGKTTIRVEIPVNQPDKFLKLCADIIKRDTSPGIVSPLRSIAMGEFQIKTNSSSALLTQSRELHKKAQGKTQRAYTIIGTDKGQTSRTEGTLYFMLDKIRGLLLKIYKGEEEQLEQWGFNVVITETMPDRKSKRLTIIIPKETIIVVNNVINGSEMKNIGKATLSVFEGTDAESTDATARKASALELKPDKIWKVNAPSGILTIKNLSSNKTGRCKVDTKK